MIIAFAGNKLIGLHSLQVFFEFGISPAILLLPDAKYGDKIDEIIRLCPNTEVIIGNQFKTSTGLEKIKHAEVDYLFSVHFPYLFPKEILAIPKIGTLNLHPAYLPYNRGWHTPTWAIYDNTPYGATLHWVDEGIDTGNIAIRKRLEVLPSDTAHTLYQRVLLLEEEILREAIPMMLSSSLPNKPQEKKETFHLKEKIGEIQKLNLSKQKTIGQTLQLLRALTTNSWEEAAYFTLNGIKYRVRLDISEETKNEV